MSAPRRTQHSKVNQMWFRRVLFLTSLYIIVFIGPLLLAQFAGGWLRNRFATAWWVMPVAIFGLLATLAPLIYLNFLRRIETRFLNDQRRYHRTLIAASSGMTRVKDMAHLCRLIVYMVNHAVRLTNTALFLYEQKEQKYYLRAVRRKKLMPDEITVGQHDPIIQLLQERMDILLLDELEKELESTQDSQQLMRLKWTYDWMRELEVRLVVPSFSNDSLLAFLVLGSKTNGVNYTLDDIAMFSGLANQGALALENAIFFEELRASEAYMIQSEKLASLGQLASGMAHEIHNPLTIISGESQLFLERFRGKNPDVDQVLDSIVEECQRASDITRRILRFARPAPTDFRQIDVRAVVEESLALAAYQVKLDRIDRIVDFPEQLPNINGNQNQLQEVILNLIINACQAMGDRGGKLEISGEYDEPHEMVELRVEDNGPGIEAGKLTKIFDPFFTTKQTGTGLGLFVSQRIIKLHQGVMTVDTKEGEGTRFTICLPIWKEPAPPESELATQGSGR